MKNIEINQIVKDLISFIGKEVSFSYSVGDLLFEVDGLLSSVLLNLTGDHEFCLDDGSDFYSFSEVIDFKVLDPI